jgi:hypothetical protein
MKRKNEEQQQQEREFIGREDRHSWDTLYHVLCHTKSGSCQGAEMMPERLPLSPSLAKLYLDLQHHLTGS